MPGTRDEGRTEAGGWEDSGGRRGDLTQVPSEAVTSRGNDSLYVLYDQERKQVASYCLSNGLLSVVSRRDGPGRGLPVFRVALIALHGHVQRAPNSSKPCQKNPTILPNGFVLSS